VTAVITTARNRGPVTYEPLLTSTEVGALFRVDSRTVARWSRDGRIPAVRNPGTLSNWRYRETDIRALLAERAQ
jgi:predicted site-specific integrase-resolvase